MKHFWSRRDFLFQSGGGISGLALAYLLNQDGLLAAGACDAQARGYNPYAPKQPHFAPRATRVISLFMSGASAISIPSIPSPPCRNTPASR